MIESQSVAKELKYGFIFGILASLFNYLLLVPVYGQLYFHFGQVCVLLCLLLCSFRSALLASTLSVLTLSIFAEHGLFVLPLYLELLAIFYLGKKGFNILVSGIIYWLVVGLPCVYFQLQWYTEFSNEYLILASAKQFANSVVYLLGVCIIFMLLPARQTKKLYPKNNPSLAGFTYFMLNISIILPTIVVALFLTTRNVTQQEKQIQYNLESSATQFSHLLSSHLSTHMQIIDTLSDVMLLSDSPNQILSSTQDSFPGFISMVLVDESGLVFNAAPKEFYEKLMLLPETQRSVIDREYFNEPKRTGKQFLSNAFVGRGFGSDIIVAISSPILSNGKFEGVIEGSLNLPKFSELENDIFSRGEENFIIVTDASKQIVYSSKKLGLELLQPFQPNEIKNYYSDESRMLSFGKDQDFLFDSKNTSFGWTVHILSSSEQVIRIFTLNIIILAVTLMLVCGVFLFISKKFVNQLTFPITNLINNFEKGKVESNAEFTTREIEQLALKLNSARKVMEDFSQKLKEEVSEKTKQLLKLNKELLKLSNEDSLTGLLNRRSFDEQVTRIININSRNKQCMGVIIIDIDEFKTINDQYGHDVGDQCLLKTSEVIRHHFHRSSDICARYGGDEFVIFFGTCDLVNQPKQLEEFRLAINNLVIKNKQEHIRFTVSIGMAAIKTNFNVDLVSMLKYADEELYKSKHQGRNRINSKIV